MIEFHDVHKTYRVARRDVMALQPTRLRIEAGEVFGLIGHSGAGKSTLLRLINRLEEPSGGRILVNGEDVTALDATAGRFFQPIDQAQQGALAGAGVADQAEHLAGADFQPGRLQRGNIVTGNPVGFMDVLEFDHGRTLWLRRSQDFRRKAGILPVWRSARSFAPCRLSECMILIGKANRRRRQPCGPQKGH